MKKLYLLLCVLIPILAKAQTVPAIDTAHYLIKPNPTVMRTDTLATNLLTYNQTTHQADLMSGGTLKSYFQSNIPYAILTGKPTIVTATAGTGISITSGVVTNTAPDQTVTLTAGNGIAISGTYPNFTIAVVQPTFSFPTRTVNSNFTSSTTKAALVFYSVLCTVTNPALAGSSSATVTLQYSTNAGSTWQDAAQTGNLSSVALAVAVQISNGQTAELVSVIPTNALIRINSVTAGTATVSVVKSTEIVY